MSLFFPLLDELSDFDEVTAMDQILEVNSSKEAVNWINLPLYFHSFLKFVKTVFFQDYVPPEECQSEMETLHILTYAVL